MKGNRRHDAEVARLWPTQSAVEIARVLGVHASTVKRVATRLRLQPRCEMSADRDDSIREWWPTETTAAIAERLGVHPSAVSRRARKMGLPSKPKGPPQRHGTRARYVAGCRCGECREANAQYGRKQRIRLTWRVDPCIRLDVPRPSAWRCPCDAWRINQGSVCGSCGQAPPWMAAGNDQLKGAG